MAFCLEGCSSFPSGCGGWVMKSSSVVLDPIYRLNKFQCPAPLLLLATGLAKDPLPLFRFNRETNQNGSKQGRNGQSERAVESQHFYSRNYRARAREARAQAVFIWASPSSAWGVKDGTAATCIP